MDFAADKMVAAICAVLEAGEMGHSKPGEKGQRMAG